MNINKVPPLAASADSPTSKHKRKDELIKAQENERFCCLCSQGQACDGKCMAKPSQDLVPLWKIRGHIQRNDLKKWSIFGFFFVSFQSSRGHCHKKVRA